MNSFSLSLRYLSHKASSTLLQTITFAAGVAMIVALLLINAQLNNEFTKNLQGIDLVVGAKGSPMQLILSSVFHLDIPNGNIPLDEAVKIEKHPLVKSAIPVALGDNYNGFRIVGTKPAYAEHYKAELAEGAFWNKEMQAVLGAEVAAKSGLKLGDTFFGSHGLTAGGEAHTDFPYTVAGILKPTGSVVDRLVLTGVESVWHIHEAHHHHEGEEDHDHEKHADEHHEEHDSHHHDEDEHEEHGKHADHYEHDEHEGEREITALLVTYTSPMAAATMPRMVNSTSSLQAASPAFEVARLVSFMGTGSEALRAIGYFLIGLAALGMFVTLTNAMNERRYDLALMRSFGAPPAKLFGLVITESVIMAMLGVVLGILFGHIAVELLASWLADAKHILITGKLFLAEEKWLLLMGLVIGVAAAVIPAFKVYRIDIFKTLVKR
jgi:putative ABC transport system permease protein